MDKQLQSLAKTSNAVSEKGQTGFADLPAEETVKPSIRDISADKLQAYLPVVRETEISVTRFSPSKTDKCVFKSAAQASLSELVSATNICISVRNLAVAERLATEIAKSNSTSPWGNFYFSLLSTLEGKYEKALHLAELSLKKEADLPVLIYQRGRAYYFMKQLAQANSDFVRASDLGLKTAETSLMNGVVSFAQGDCISVIEEFSKLDRKMVSELALAPVMSECFAQKGEFDRAISYAEETVKSYARPADLLMQIARVHEVYRFDSSKALTAYESAIRAASEADAKEWLVRKVQWLKNQGAPTKVGEVSLDLKSEGEAP